MKTRMAAVVAGALMTVTSLGPAAQAGFLEDLLFAPTQDPRDIPQTYGTPYDCSVYKAAGNTSGWKGIVAGRNIVFERYYNETRVGCFQTRAECEAFTTYISGFIELEMYNRCEPF